MNATMTSLVGAARRGDGSAAKALFDALYDELHRLAKRELARHGGIVSLGAITLLHQACIDMAVRRWEKARIHLHRSIRADLAQ